MDRGCAAAGLRNIAVTVTTITALEALRKGQIVVVRSDGGGGLRHAGRGATGDQVA